MSEPSERCAHAQAPKRVCDLCESEDRVFLACSLACLDAHIDGAHGWPEHEPSAQRALAYARALNQRFPDSWDGYATHRARISELLLRLPRGGELCVLGAGNGNDLELERLAAHFSEIHLVDLDGEALERARERQGTEVRGKIVLHAELDLSGVLNQLDAWGEVFPDRATLGGRAVAAAQGIVRELGRSFPAVISTGVLSQLPVPFQRAWITSRTNWGDLLSTLTAIHLATLAGSTRPGGNAVLVVDVASSRETPALSGLRGQGSEAIARSVSEARASGELRLRLDPDQLARQLSAPGMRSLVSELSIEPPWLWPLGVDTQLVYGLSFRHPVG